MNKRRSKISSSIRALYILAPALLALVGSVVINNEGDASFNNTDLLSQIEILESSAETQPVVGNQPWISIMCKFPDNDEEPKSEDFFKDMYIELEDYWEELSYGYMTLDGSTAAGWFTLPYPTSYYYPYDKRGMIFSHCIEAADPYVYFPQYYGINSFNNTDINWIRGGKIIRSLDGITKEYGVTDLGRFAFDECGYADGSCDTDTVKHEMGHGLGLSHSAGPYGQQYDSPWDVMSGGGGRHTIAYHKDILGWIPPERKYLASIGSIETIVLKQLAYLPSENYLIVEIPILDGEPDHIYTVEARRSVGRDYYSTGDAIVIHDVIPFRPQPPPNYALPPAQVVDIDGNGKLGDDGDMWLVGESFVDASNGITVTVESETTTGYMVTIDLYSNLTESLFLPVAISN